MFGPNFMPFNLTFKQIICGQIAEKN